MPSHRMKVILASLGNSSDSLYSLTIGLLNRSDHECASALLANPDVPSIIPADIGWLVELTTALPRESASTWGEYDNPLPSSHYTSSPLSSTLRPARKTNLSKPALRKILATVYLSQGDDADSSQYLALLSALSATDNIELFISSLPSLYKDAIK